MIFYTVPALWPLPWDWKGNSEGIGDGVGGSGGGGGGGQKVNYLLPKMLIKQKTGFSSQLQEHLMLNMSDGPRLRTEIKVGA